MSREKYLTASEIKDILAISKSQMYNLIDSGELTPESGEWKYHFSVKQVWNFIVSKRENGMRVLNVPKDLSSLQLLRAKEVAEKLNVVPSFVYQLAKIGELARIRIRKTVRFHLQDVKAFIDQKEDGVSSPENIFAKQLVAVARKVIPQ